MPEEWTCLASYYDAGDGCDCECGAYDPDCDDPVQPVLNCDIGEVCSPLGVCEAGEDDGVEGWTCLESYYDAGDGCDCDCGAYDPDCDDPGATVYGCGIGERCDETGACFTPEEPDDGVPDAWTCLDFYYDAGDGCDCDCGAYDPDCDDPDASVLNCDDGETCDATGVCVDDGTSEGPPSEWTCLSTWYGAGDGCDCECGAYDPDCDDPDASVLRCATGETCNAEGVCVPEEEPPEEPTVPEEWACVESYYDAGDGCDCACGAYDPDCDDPGASVLNCSLGEICDATGVCVEDSSAGGPPSAWTCLSTWYDAGDGCDCNCGAYDPDCDDPAATVYRCSTGETCNAEGVCVSEEEPPEEPTVPEEWACVESYYDAGDGCDCQCGAYDPDCDDPSASVLNCSFGEVCDATGACVEDTPPDGPPTTWTCISSWYDAGDGCDCNCGAYDPDCDDPAATVYRCSSGETCNAEGVCVSEEEPPDDSGVPALWACLESYYAAGDGCDCQCGAYDPDCDDPSATVYNCLRR